MMAKSGHGANQRHPNLEGTQSQRTGSNKRAVILKHTNRATNVSAEMLFSLASSTTNCFTRAFTQQH
jgi:hypothetical protein